MNVFVLGTGRCGTLTFTRACKHLTNYTSGHETLAKAYGPRRFAYPVRHIEVDNRLSWFLGQLASRFDRRKVLYVHLRRDPEATAMSHLRRWNNTTPSIIRAFGNGIVQRADWPDDERLAVCRAYVNTVTTNIQEFLRGRPSMTMWVEKAQETFPAFLDRIGAEGDVDLAIAEWRTVHNATPEIATTSSWNLMVDRTSSSELLRIVGRRLWRRALTRIHWHRPRIHGS